MSLQDLLSTLLGAIGLRLPVLIAACAALVWVFPAPRGPVRTGALVGLFLLAATSVLNMLFSLVPVWLLNAGDFATVSALSRVIGQGRLVLGLLDAFALVLVVWAMTRALRQATPPPQVP